MGPFQVNQSHCFVSEVPLHDKFLEISIQLQTFEHHIQLDDFLAKLDVVFDSLDSGVLSHWSISALKVNRLSEYSPGP